MNLKFTLIFFFLVLYERIEGGLVTLKEAPSMLNGQIQHVLTSDNPGAVEYSDIPVYGRKMLNEFEMGGIGEDKVEGKSKGNKQGKGNKKIRNEKVIPNVDVKNRFALLEKLKEEGEEKENKKLNKVIEKTKIENNEEEKEEENCNQNCEEVVCEDEEEIGEMKNGHNEARKNRKLKSSPKSSSSPKSQSSPKSSGSSPGSKTPAGTGYHPYYYGGSTYYYGSSNSSNCCCKKRTIQAVVFGYLPLSSIMLMAPSFDQQPFMNCVVSHGFNGGKQLKCELGDDKFYKCTNIMGDYPKEVRSKGFNKREYKLECPIGPNGSNMEVAKANATLVEGEKRNWFVQFILNPVKNVTSGWNNTKV